MAIVKCPECEHVSYCSIDQACFNCGWIGGLVVEDKPKPIHTQWEYKEEAFVLDGELEKLGLDGWELCGITAETIYFKRPIL